MTTYVRNHHGRVVGNNPWTLLDFWKLLKHTNLDDYTTTSR